MAQYESQFTIENLNALIESFKKTIVEVSKTQDKKLDVFVIISALSSVAFDYTMAVLPRSEEERTQVYEQMKSISNDIFMKLDALALEHKTTGMADIAALAHSLSLSAEYFAKRRDEALSSVNELKQQDEAVAPSAEQGE